MKVHRYIYTRLSKDLSPTGKNGFQSAFLPGDLLSSKDVLEIESHIHFPEGAQRTTQSVVFYKQLRGQWYMVLLLLDALPEVKDEHGRSGAFLCQGFLLAEQDWRPIWQVADLKHLLTPHLFATLDALLASPDVDRQTGRIADLQLDPPTDYWTRNLLDLEDEPEDAMLMAMYHLAKTQDRDLAIVVEGDPQAVSKRLDICAMFMPDALRPRLGWNDAFDGGKIFFSPLRIFGYSQVMPVAGKPIAFPADSSAPQCSEAELMRFCKESDPFSRWLLEVSVNAVPRNRLDAMFVLSEAIVSGKPTSPTMESDPIFELVNRDAIRQVFSQGMLTHFDTAWVTRLAELSTTRQQLTIWLGGYEPRDLVELLEVSILAQSISPEIIPDAPPSHLLAKGSPTLQALGSMWTHTPLSDALLSEIAETQIPEVLALLLATGSHETLPYAGLASFFSKYLHKLARDPKVAVNLRPYLAAKVPAEYLPFKVGMSTVAVQVGEYGALQDEPIDWLRLLDRWLANTGGDPETWKAAKQLGKSQNLGAYPNLKAFALGEAAFPHDLERNIEGRKGFLRCLIEVHGIKEEKLLDMGFFATEVKENGGSSGFFGKIKRLFGN
jgi:hypothetical protein